MESIDYWYAIMNRPDLESEQELHTKMVASLEHEFPRLCSLILERACNLQCLHCIFQPEKTSSAASHAVSFTDLACNIISQMEPSPFVIHEGRILQSWHLDLFSAIRRARPDARIGMIDNGTYLRHEKTFQESGVRLNWLDISFDGTRNVHNAQRNNSMAFDTAMKGLIEGRRFVLPSSEGGKLTTLFTVTNMNYGDVYNTAALLLGQSLVDEFHITPFSPVRTEIEPLFFCPGYKTGNVDECKVLWEQIQKIWSEFHEKHGKKVFVRVYQHADLEKIARAVGPQKFLTAFQDTKNISVDRGSIRFEIDSVGITYVPLSICPSETFVIDADGSYRMAYCLKYTLEELNSGISKEGKDTRAYTVKRLQRNTDFHNVFLQGVHQWMHAMGNGYLKNEWRMFQELRTLN